MTYGELGRHGEAICLRQDIYSAYLRLEGEESEDTLRAAFNYANSLAHLERNAEAKVLMRKTLPVARRVLGKSHRVSLGMGWRYARLLFEDDGATLADLREAVSTLVESEPTARRVFGGAHPLTEGIERALRNARALLRARETPPAS